MEEKAGVIQPLTSAWKTIPFVCRTLTPIWAGGIPARRNGEMVRVCAEEIKASTLIGSLRYWADLECRATDKSVCDGKDWCGASQTQTCAVCSAFGSTTHARRFHLLVSGLTFDEEKGGLWGDEFRVEIRYRTAMEGAENAAELAKMAFRRICRQGAFGARTQEGYGQICLLRDPDTTEIGGT